MCVCRVTGSISKKTSYVVVGRDAGPKKLEKIQQLGTKTLNEDQFYDFLENAPGQDEPDYSEPKESGKKVRHVN